MRSFWAFVLAIICSGLTAIQAQTGDELVTSAVLKFEAGEYAECLTQIEEALSSPDALSPKELAQAYLYRGRLYLRQQMDSAAVGNDEALADAQLLAHEAYKKALEADDGSMTTVISVHRTQLYPLLFNTGIDAYNRSLQSEGDARAGHLDDALQYVSAAYEIRPDNYRLSDLLGRIHFSSDRYLEALGYYTTARRQYRPTRSREPDFNAITNIFLSAAIIYRRHLDPPSQTRALESVQSGLALLESEYARFTNDFSTTDEQIHQNYRNGRKALRGQELSLFVDMPERHLEAIPKFETALASDFKEDEQMHMAYASILEDVDWQNAVQSYQNALKLNPSNVSAHFNAGVLYYNHAIELINKTPREAMDPEQAEQFTEYLQNAKSYFEEVQRLSSDDEKTAEILQTINDYLQG